MNLDTILMIPHLSKELDLIGHSTLPFSFENLQKCKANDRGSPKVVFDSQKMIETLVTVCFELVKQVKKLGFSVDDSEIDKLNFQVTKLKKQLKLNQSDMQKKENELITEKEKNRLLKVRIESLEKKVNECDLNLKKQKLKSSSSEAVLKHNLKKTENDLEELHKLVWKKFNMTDQNFFPKNFEIIQLEQPDFNKLWSEVKFSTVRNKEEAFKKAICMFQENNKILMKDNILFKNLLLVTLQEINDVLELMTKKMHLGKSKLLKDKIIEIFKNIEKVDMEKYKEVLDESFETFKKICEVFEEASFMVSDDLFICWSDIIRSLHD